jgi:hypothetical protein
VREDAIPHPQPTNKSAKDIDRKTNIIIRILWPPSSAFGIVAPAVAGPGPHET